MSRRLETWRTDAESGGTARTELTRLPRGLAVVRCVALTVLLLVALLLCGCSSPDRPEEQTPFPPPPGMLQRMTERARQHIGIWPFGRINNPVVITPDQLEEKNAPQIHRRRCTPDGCTLAAAVRLRD